MTKSKEIRRLNSDLIDITKSIVLIPWDYSAAENEGMCTMDIAMELYNKGYRKQGEGECHCPNCGAKMKGTE